MKADRKLPTPMWIQSLAPQIAKFSILIVLAIAGMNLAAHVIERENRLHIQQKMLIERLK